MTQRTIHWMAAGLLLGSLVTQASALDSTCTLTSMRQDSLAPATLAFPVPTNGEQLPMTIDEATGAVTVNFGALPIMNFPNGFSDQSELDTIFFQDEPVTGTIDAGGNVVLPHVRGINCTQGKCPGGPPCPCVPGNVCSNDVTRVCVPAGTGDLSCPPVDPDPNPGVCQGVCSNDRTTSCASELDCTPPGFCGEGVGMRLDATFTTGAPTFEGFTVLGSGAGLFTDGALRFVAVHSTPPETYGIGDVGVSMLMFSCDLDPLPSADALPQAGWAVKKGTVKLGTGAPGDADDSLSVKGAFVPHGDIDFAADDLSLSLASDDGLVATLIIPNGSLVANSKGNKWKLVDKDGSVVTIAPTPPAGATPSHKVSVKKGKTGAYSIALSSKGLNLDGADTDALVSGLSIGAETPSERSPVTAKKSKRTF